MRAIGVCLAATLIAGAAAAASLDAPVIPTHPTLRSEIKRGGDAAFQCAMTGDPLGLERLVRCVDDAQSRNRQQMGTAYEAFDAGLYFRAWVNFHIAAHLAETSSVIDPVMANGDEKYAWSVYREARKKIGVSDEDTVDALGMVGPIRANVAAAVAKFGD